MDETEIIKGHAHGKAFGIIIAEAAAVLCLLIVILAAKYFFSDCFLQMREWYDTEFCSETETREVTETSGGAFDEV